MNASLTRNRFDRTQQHDLGVQFSPGAADKTQPTMPWKIWSRTIVRPVVIVNGHPDSGSGRFCAALCDSFAAGVRARGLDATRLNIAALGSDADLHDVRSANSIVIVYPLWLDRPPALVSSFFEKAARLPAAKKQTARLIVTMDMPAFMYRAVYRRDESAAKSAHAVDLPGFSHALPIFIGTVATLSAAQRAEWLLVMHKLGQQKRDRVH